MWILPNVSWLMLLNDTLGNMLISFVGFLSVIVVCFPCCLIMIVVIFVFSVFWLCICVSGLASICGVLHRVCVFSSCFVSPALYSVLDIYKGCLWTFVFVIVY